MGLLREQLYQEEKSSEGDNQRRGKKGEADGGEAQRSQNSHTSFSILMLQSCALASLLTSVRHRCLFYKMGIKTPLLSTSRGLLLLHHPPLRRWLLAPDPAPTPTHTAEIESKGCRDCQPKCPHVKARGVLRAPLPPLQCASGSNSPILHPPHCALSSQHCSAFLGQHSCPQMPKRRKWVHSTGAGHLWFLFYTIIRKTIKEPG